MFVLRLTCLWIISGDRRPIRATAIDLPCQSTLISVALQLVCPGLAWMIPQPFDWPPIGQVLLDYHRHIFESQM